MSFSATVKDELCRLELGKNCCMLSELAALYRTSGSLTFHGGGRVQVQYRVENTALARRIFRLLTARMAITPRLHYVQHACQLAHKPRLARGNLKVIVLVGRCHCPRAEERRPQVRPAAALARQVMAHNRPPIRHHAVFVLINQVECQHQPL